MPNDDLVHFEIEPKQDIGLPTSDEGTSGGANWRLFDVLTSYRTNQLVETRLTGVALYQLPGKIIGNGRAVSTTRCAIGSWGVTELLCGYAPTAFLGSMRDQEEKAAPTVTGIRGSAMDEPPGWLEDDQPA